jgi:protein tyrosine/serine phosphatase
LEGATGPVFVHCKRGADRTGAVIAAYQIDFLKWDNARAYQYAKLHGIGRFQVPRQDYIKAFQARAVHADGPAVANAQSAPATTESSVKN